MNTPIFSIITSTLNSEDYVERCVQSVLGQSFQDVEHIIVDGASSDSTLERLSLIDDSRLVVLSESDTGIYNAWNKGVDLARGQWILFLGSDDFFPDLTALQTIADQILIDPRSMGFVSTRLSVGSVDGDTVIRTTPFGWRPIGEILDSPVLNMPPHGGMFHSRAIFDQGYRFDETYHGSADKKLFFDVFHLANIQYVDVVLTYFSLGGITNSAGNKLKRWMEKRRLRRDLGLPFFAFAFVRSLFSSIIRDCIHRLGSSSR